MTCSVVVGGGIAGMMCALLLAERHGAEVTLIEREAELGGLLRAFNYGEHGRFDYGMHNMYETGVPDLDRLLWGLLPDAEWQVLEGRRRDLAGLYFRGRLQTNSLYPDLRRLPRPDLERCVADLFLHLNLPQSPQQADAYSQARARFGQTIADLVITPSLEKIHRKPASELDCMAAALTSMSRVVLYDEAPFLDLMKSDLLRERIAFPEQRNLPEERASGRRGFYPRHYGMYRVVEALAQRLRTAGVRILCRATVAGIVAEGNRIKAIDCETRDGRERIEGVGRVCWTSGLPALAPLLGAMPAKLPFDRPLRTVVVNFLLRQPPAMGDLYYFYCYDPGFSTFRVTHYGAYCDGAPRNGGHPVCVELLEQDDGKLDPRDLEHKARRELESFGVLAAGNDVIFARAELLASGFPMPSLRNIQGLATLREAIVARQLENLQLFGILAEPGLFFQRDVVTHAFRVLKST